MTDRNTSNVTLFSESLESLSLTTPLTWFAHTEPEAWANLTHPNYPSSEQLASFSVYRHAFREMRDAVIRRSLADLNRAYRFWSESEVMSSAELSALRKYYERAAGELTYQRYKARCRNLRPLRFRLGYTTFAERASHYSRLASTFPFETAVRFRDASGRFCTPGPEAERVEFYGVGRVS